MPDRKCAIKILGDAMKIKDATPAQLKKIEECSILAAGGTPNPKKFKKRGYKQPDTLNVGKNANKQIISEKLK